MRHLDILVLSDLHLGTFGCHAKELIQYLKSVRPEKLILNGDIIDAWNFKKRYFPTEHYQVIEILLEMMQDGVEIYYLTGNHDDILRRLSDVKLGRFNLLDKLVLRIDGEDYWFFHGDVFDASIQHAKWIAKLGGKGYDMLIWINRRVNLILNKMGRPPMSLSKAIKNNVKKAVKYMHDFENVAAELAIDQGYDYVVCGHIHLAQNRRIVQGDKHVQYMNSGDWVESLTSLEYVNKKWTIYDFHAEEEEALKTNDSPAQIREIALAH